MTKSKTRFSAVIAAIVLMITVGAIAAYPKANAATTGTPQGYEASTDTVTGYYMDVELNGLTTYLTSEKQYGKSSGIAYWSRTSVDLAVIVTFPNVQYNGMAVFVSGVCRVNMPARGLAGSKVVFEGNLHMNIRESFYRYFQLDTVDYTKCQLMVIVENTGYGLSKGGVGSGENCLFARPVTFDTKDLPPTVNDPNSPDFELGAGDGVNPAPLPSEPENSWLYNFYLWCTDLFKWKVSYAQFQVLFWVLAALIAIALFAGVRAAIFGK